MHRRLWSYFAFLFVTRRGHWRAAWRLVFTAFTWLSLTLALSTLVAVAWVLAGGNLLEQVAVQNLNAAAFGVLVMISALATALTLALAARFWEPAAWADWGLLWGSAWWRDLVLGFGVAGLVQAALALALYLTDSVRWQAAWPWAAAWPELCVSSGVWLGIFALVGWYEEALMRGYLYTTVARASGRPWVGAVVSSVVFALLHADNPAYSWAAGLGLFLAGLFFVAVRRPGPQGLALPVGVHWGWNFFEGVVFGFPVSGLRLTPWWQARITGPAWWTGGAFGPEAGAVLLVGLAVGWLLLRGRAAQPATREGQP